MYVLSSLVIISSTAFDGGSCEYADYVTSGILVVAVSVKLFTHFFFLHALEIVLRFVLIQMVQSFLLNSLEISIELVSLQGKVKKTRKFATVKRMLNPNDIRL